MKSTSWKDIAELIGIAAIVASLIFVGVQMRQTQRIAYAEQQGVMIDSRLFLNEVVASNAELLIKVNSGASLTAAEQIAADRLLDSQWSSAFWSYQRWYYLDHPALHAPLRGFAIFLVDNPGMRKRWLDIRQTFKIRRDATDYDGPGTSAKVIAIVDEMLIQLDRTSGPQTPSR